VTRARLGREGGFTLIPVAAVMLVLMLLSVAAFAAAQGDIHLSQNDLDQKRAYAAAEAGVHDYLFHLNEDNAYWARCTNVAPPAKVSQAWNGVGPDTRTGNWRNVPGSDTRYAIELLPANGATACNPTNAQPTMIDTATGSFAIRTTGQANGVKRSIITTFRRRGFLDYLYFTDYETSDPYWYMLDTAGRPTRSGSAPLYNGGDVVDWASHNCGAKHWVDTPSRGSLAYSGQVWTGSSWVAYNDTCTEIQFVGGDVVAGPLHTNDQLFICGAPTFGRNTQDRVEVSAPPQGWRPNTGCSGSNPNFQGQWSPGSPTLFLPPSDASLKNITDPAYRFTGKTSIVLNGTSMTVNGTSMPLPPNGVVFVSNGACGLPYQPLDPYNHPAGCADVSVRGTYADDLTIASDNDIIVDGNIGRTGDKMLGLIANEFIRVYHPVIRDPTDPTSCTNAPGTMNDITIDAAILSLAHSFTVDNYYCGAPLGRLTLNGTIGQKYRGPVGRSSAGTPINGYLKRYTYDDRLRFRSPPHFLDPVQASWRLQRDREQVPAR
jgi:hypothetical protein